MAEKVTKRIKTEITDWDAQNRIFQNIHDRMVAIFKAEFKSIEAELKTIENNFTSEETVPSTLDGMKAEADVFGPDFDLTLNKIPITGFTAPLWVPIGLVVGLQALPAAGIMTKKRREKKALKTMKENLEKNMEELTLSVLDEITQSTKLAEALDEKVKKVKNAFTNLLEDIQRFIEADRKILDKMELEVRDQSQQLAQTYTPLYMEIEDLIKHMSCLYLSAIRAYDIDVNNLGQYEYLGEGEFACVYRAWWTPTKSKPPLCVSIKAFKDPVTPDNACEALREEENLW